jgi:HD-GYP domain-containing protein (c-di-GMP phosphodiesterase class II)
MQAAPRDVPPGQVRTADVLAALSLASDLGVGLPAEHGLRACYLGLRIAAELGLSDEDRADLYYAELLMDAGCTAFTSQLASYIVGEEIAARRELYFHTDVRNPLAVMGWLGRYMAVDAPLPLRATRGLDFAVHGKTLMREGFRNTCDTAQRLAARLGMPPRVQTALMAIFEQWDGGGMPNGLSGEAIPMVARIVYATSFMEVFHRAGGPEAMLRLARSRRGRAFDPRVVDAAEAAAGRPGFWDPLERESAWDIVLAQEPDSPWRCLPEDRLPELATSFADFADLKAPYSAGHSRRVADLASRLEARLTGPDSIPKSVEIAGLLHDLGHVCLPSYLLNRPSDSWTQAEHETFRLHPYYGQRILERIAAFRPAAGLVIEHHERMDGSGYPHGLEGSRIASGARILAVANEFDELTHAAPGRDAFDPDDALRAMRSGAGFWPAALDALRDDLAGEPPPARRARLHDWPAGLTDREVEVLRLLASGHTRRQIGEALVVTDSTVRAHIEHIYNKAGLSTRSAATLFAVEHGLLA